MSLDTLRPTATKVPQIIALFWVTKILTTGMGETLSDFLANSINPAVAVVAALAGLGLALRLQLRADQYVAGRYWLAVSMVSVFGTMAADAVHLVGVPYPFSTALYVVVVGAVFAFWYRSEGTLSIHSIVTARRERLYWCAVLATFALGTAAGDLTASTLGLGYLASGLLFAVAILVPAVGYWRFGLNPVVAFWGAYILTRPLGASFADWAGRDHALGGLGLGTGWVSLVLCVLIAGCVAYLAATRADVDPAVEVV